MLQRLLEGMYMPHGYCLLWEPWLISLHAVSDVVTFLAYSAIPIAIWIFISKRKDLELKGLARLFAAFILWCGLTHLFNVITLWHPIYEMQGIVKAVTACVSLVTATMIFPLIPKALAIPSPRQLQLVNSKLESEIASHRQTLAELEHARADLESKVAERTKELQQATENFRLLFEHAPVAMVLVDPDGHLQQANEAAAALFATDRDELLKLGVDRLLPAFRTQNTGDELGNRATRMHVMHEQQANRFSGDPFPVEVGTNPLSGEIGRSVVVSVIDISDRKRQEERLKNIMRELTHRSKNLLAVIQGMARQAAASSTDLGAFDRSFRERLQGLAGSHDLLIGNNWSGVSIFELVKTQTAIAENSGASKISSQGPDILLSPEATQNLGMALHELVTNSLKYGALAKQDDHVQVSWIVENRSGEAWLQFKWQEFGGGTLVPPKRVGFGRTVLQRIVPTSFQGSAVLEFTPGGMWWELDAPLFALTG